MNETGAGTGYEVVVNNEEQYSIWPTHLPIPIGWRAIGFRGERDACLRHVCEVWRDMRPLSLRRQLDDPTGDEGLLPPK